MAGDPFKDIGVSGTRDRLALMAAAERMGIDSRMMLSLLTYEGREMDPELCARLRADVQFADNMRAAGREGILKWLRGG